MPAQNRARITAISIILTPHIYNGYVDNRSWFRTCFFGAEKSFRLMPAVDRVSRYPGPSSPAAMRRGGRAVQVAAFLAVVSYRSAI
jgi:hypothetical protein